MESHTRRNKPIKKTEAPQAIQLALAPAPHRNQQLFSDYYLDTILPARTDWQALASEANDVLQDLQALFANYTPSDKEAQVEEEFIKPVLRRLGHTFEVQPSLETPDGTKTPDYVFYCDQATVVAQKKKKLNDTLLANSAIAVGDAKAWDRPLDVSLKRTGGDPFTNKNPSFQISFYIQHTGLPWGILTNGRLWRLYHKDTAHKLDRFYEVNLPELLESDDVDKFLYFYGFFRRQAFDPGDLCIENIRQASVEYARGVSDSLKKQVYDALRHLAQGFLDYPQNHLHNQPETLKEIYDNSLILLYRLLFILYAESRDLLPVHENLDYSGYYSLDHLKRTIQQNLKTGRMLVSTTKTLWTQLKDLFQIIDEGNAKLNVTTFNGGLFNPLRHPFLEQYTIGDYHLQQAIDMLARVDGQFVDYRDLAERHLGTIYEGLLEFHLESVAAEASSAGAGSADHTWTIDLKNEKGERKASGSYYTPDYIVKYMVEETVGPVLRQAIAHARNEEEKIQAVLAIKVLDPAMGSGHFPVEVTDYIARFLVEHIEQSETEGESELAFWRRRVAQSCIYGLDLNPLAVNLAQLSLWLATVAKGRPLSFLDHHLRCGNALVGAHLTELRTETAKSGRGRGRRETSSRPTATQKGVMQQALFDEESLRQVMTTAVDLMWMIKVNPAQTIGEVKEQEQTYKEIRQKLTDKYSRLANIVSATHFGLSFDQTFWKPLSDYATGRTTIAPPQFESWLQSAQSVADSLHFFHWELEYPEVFFNKYGQHKGPQAGFDVVIGNPPYVRQEKLSTFKPYFAAHYPETYDGVADLYTYFYQQGLHLTQANGRMSYIVTNKWMRSGYGQPLRTFFSQTGALERIVDFGHAPIFEDAEVFPCILTLQKPEPDKEDQPERQVQVLTFPREELQRLVQQKQSLDTYIHAQSHSLPHNRFSNAAWNLETSAVDNLLAKIQRIGTPLAAYAGIKPAYGIKTGLNEAFLIDTPIKNRIVREDPRSVEIIKPYLRGQDIKRWSPEWANLWMIVLKSSGDYAWPWSNTTDSVRAEEIFHQTYPSLYNHFKPLEERLRHRQDKGRNWWELRACAYYNIFDQPKIITQDLATYSWFSFDNQGLYAVNTCYIWSTADLYMLGWLCSPIAWWILHRMLQHGINDTLRMFGEQVQNLPIAPPTDDIRSSTEQAVTQLIKIKQTSHEARQVLLDWLQTEFEVGEPGKRLENVFNLDEQGFTDEVRKRRPTSAKKLTPAALKELRNGYNEQIGPLQGYKATTETLERQINDLINLAYGLSPEEVALLWETAPPHMPLQQ